ncbi:MAG: rod shape-determining protein MreC [bacterium]
MIKKRFFIYIFIISTVILLLLPPWIMNLSPESSIITKIKIKTNSMVSYIHQSLTILSDIHSVGRENMALRKKISKLKVQLLLSEAIKKENEELSKLLKIKDSYSKYTIIPAKILDYSTTNPNSITIKYPKQFSKNMAEKATVVSSMGMVGLVTDFSENTAEVILLTSKQFSIPAVFDSREKCTGVLKGNGRSMSMLFVDKVCNEPPAEGTKLLSANISQNYSLPYIPLGIIGQVQEDPSNSLFIKGDIIPLYQKGKLNHLFIIVGTDIRDEKF